MTDYQPPCEPPKNLKPSAAWIAGRIETLLSHYFQPDQAIEVTEAAMDDWLKALGGFSQPALEHACDSYLRDQPRRRPTPGDIRFRASSFRVTNSGEGKRDALSHDERELLEGKILPTARRWLSIPGLAEYGQKTLEYWGEGNTHA